MRRWSIWREWLFIGFGHRRWCRRLLGGTWRWWWITICGSYIWLPDPKDPPKDWRPPCSEGPAVAIEIYPPKEFFW